MLLSNRIRSKHQLTTSYIGAIMKFNTVWILLISLTLMACTSKELYNQTKLQVKTHCDTKVGIEREQCLEKMNTKSYKDYEAERQDIMKNK